MIKNFWLRLASKPTSRISRRERILRLIEPNGKRGIEIGPLNRPIVTCADGDVLYADHLSKEGLRHKYANDPGVNHGDFNDLVEVDIVTNGQALSEVLKDDERFQYVVASHVLEHIGDPIGWLIECTKILHDNGLIILVLPDRRFTFDRFRADTTTGELIANYHSKVTCPTPSQVFEYAARNVYCGPKDVLRLWRGECDESLGGNESQLREALRLEIDVTWNKTYVDAHCSTFTPYSFSLIIKELILLGLIPVEVVTIEPTRRREAEFFVVLRKCDSASPSKRAATVTPLDPIHHGRPPAKRLRLRGRPAHALRVLLTGQTE